MFVLNAVTFSALKSAALALAIVNIIALVFISVCFLLLRKRKHEKGGDEKPQGSFFGSGENQGRRNAACGQTTYADKNKKK